MKKTVVKRKRIGQDSTKAQKSNTSSDQALKFEKTKDESGSLKKLKNKSGKAFTITMALCAVFFITSCNSPAENVQDAKEDVTQAKEDLVKAQEAYAADVELFRLEMDKQIIANEKEIAAINLKLENSKNEMRAEYKEEVATLERKNRDMKNKIHNYRTNSKENWQSFKAEFNKDMNELGMALRNLVEDN